MSRLPKNHDAAGIGALLSVCFIYGFYAIFSRLIGDSIPLFYQNVWRNVLAFAGFSLLLLFSRKWKPISGNSFLWISARAIAGTLAIVFFFLSVTTITVGMTYFIFYVASTVIGFASGVAIFKEQVTKYRILSLLLAIIGLLIIYISQIGSLGIVGMVFAFISGSSSMIWSLISKKVPHDLSIEQLSFLDTGLSLVFCIFCSILFGEHWTIPVVSVAWGANTAIGLTWLVTPYFIIFGFRILDASIASIVMLSEILFGILMARIFYQESVPLVTLVGGILIVSSIIAPEVPALLPSSRKKK